MLRSSPNSNEQYFGKRHLNPLLGEVDFGWLFRSASPPKWGSMRRAPLASFLLIAFVSLPGLAQEPGAAKTEDLPVSAEAARPVGGSGKSAGDTPSATDSASQEGTSSQDEQMRVYLEETPSEPSAPRPQTTSATPAASPSAAPRQVAVVVSPPPPSPISSMEERMRLDEEIDYLEDERDERYSLGGPIALLAVGGGMTLGGLLFLAQGVALKSAASAGGTSTSGGADAGAALMGVGVMGLAFGGGFLAGGGIWLSKRVEKRLPYNKQIDALEEQIDYYSAVELKPMVQNGSLGLAVSGAF